MLLRVVILRLLILGLRVLRLLNLGLPILRLGILRLGGLLILRLRVRARVRAVGRLWISLLSGEERGGTDQCHACQSFNGTRSP